MQPGRFLGAVTCGSHPTFQWEHCLAISLLCHASKVVYLMRSNPQVAAAPYASIHCVPLCVPRSSKRCLGAVHALCRGLALVSFVLGLAMAELKEKIAEVGQSGLHMCLLGMLPQVSQFVSCNT